jgi:hypothetical protein
VIYTLGHKPSYVRGFKEAEINGVPLMKLGRTATYQGGSVWQLRGEVEAHIAANQPRLENYAVYGVEAEWGVDTAPSPHGPWHDLLKNAPLVELWESA